MPEPLGATRSHAATCGRSVTAPAQMVACAGVRCGDVASTGTLDASSAEGRGGQVEVRGDRVTLGRDSRIDASGATGGGILHLLDDGLVGRGGLQRQLAGQQKVAGIAVGDFDQIAAVAQIQYIIFQNDFHC